jgi:hypothetical protein
MVHSMPFFTVGSLSAGATANSGALISNSIFIAGERSVLLEGVHIAWHLGPAVVKHLPVTFDGGVG